MNKDTYYTTCENCGANLDPGERCDCVKLYPAIDELPIMNYHKTPVSDALYIGYDRANNDDISCLVVARERGSQKEVIKVAYGEKADRLYFELTNK